MEGTPSMPQRPRQHQLETESRVAFEQALGAGFLYREISPGDYGIDGEVEEFDGNNEATGLRYFAQLKATDEEDPARARRRRIKLTTAEYLRAQPVPVLMVLYMAATETLYARWFHEFDSYYEHVGDTHLTFVWSDEDSWQAETAEQLADEARRAIHVKAAALELPISVSVETAPDGALDLTPTEIRLALEAGITRVPEVLELVDDESGLMLITVRPDLISANLGGLATVTMHLDSDPPRKPEGLAADLLTSGALTLARLGHSDLAARVGIHFLADSLISAIPPIAAPLAVAMAQARRIGDALDLAERLDQDDEPAMRATSLAFVLAVLNYPGVLEDHEQDRLEAALVGRMERRLAEGDTVSAAASADNLGHHYMNVRDYQRGAETLARALELDADYASRGEDFWRRLAGAHFLSGAYGDSVAAYEKALDLDDSDPWTRARYADALMYAGRYGDALEVFKELEIYEGPETDMALSAWAYVKARALRWIISETGYETQEPQMHEAAELAGQMTGEMSPEERDDLIERVWALDAACSLGWFNRARDLLDSGKESEAMHAYLVAAAMREGDVEAWVNVALLAIRTDDDSLLATSVITGGRLNANTYLAEFARQLRANQTPAEGREAILAGVRKSLMQVPSAAAAMEAEAEDEHSAHSESE